MKKLNIWAIAIGLLTNICTYAQSKLDRSDAAQPEKNTVRFSSNYVGNNSISFKFNYERNLRGKLVGFTSIEGELGFTKSIGLGLKYQILNSNNFEGLIGIEFQRSLTSFSSSCYCKNPIYNISPAIELRYYFYHSFILLFEISDPYILKRANVEDKLPSAIGLGVGYRI
jgi:hypothetical protein